METTGIIGIIYYIGIIGYIWGSIGIMEKKMETTLYIYIRVINGKENGNYYIYIYIYGLCRVYIKIPDLSSPRGLIF